MREILSIHIGQCGTNIGRSVWDLFCMEHDISPEGTVRPPVTQQLESLIDHPSCVFQEEPDKNNLRYTSRSIFIDTEHDLINEIRSTSYNRGLFRSGNLITSKQDESANYYSRGAYTIGKMILDDCMNQIRRNVESCSNFDGFMIYNSLGGGLGSGFTGLLLDRLSCDYSKKSKLSISVFPSPKQSNLVIEPYNAVHAHSKLLEHVDLSIAVDNEALYTVAANQLGLDSPSYKDINAIIAQTASDATVSMRFGGGALNTSLEQLMINLVPYQRMHFMMTSFAPFLNLDPIGYSTYGMSAGNKCSEFSTVDEITQAVFSRENSSVSCDVLKNKVVACALMYRGDVSLMEAISSVVQIRKNKTIRFMDWVPTGFKVAMNTKKATVVDAQSKNEISNRRVSVQPNSFRQVQRSCCLISNSGSINSVFQNMAIKFDKLWVKRAFVHWIVGEGIDDGEITESREQLACLEKDYEELNSDEPIPDYDID